jgi:glutathione S-transferase
MYELFQAEWCPYSSRVRQELTERGVDFVVRQVAAQREARQDMRERTGADGIPVLVAGDEVITEFEDILAFLARHHPRRPDARAHRAKAEDPEERHTRDELLRTIP